jgi:hypothetical protein
MKYLKTIGLAALAAMALMAFGASTASATELYKLTTGTPSIDTLGVGTTIDASLTGSAILETTGGEVLNTCTGGTVHGEITNAGSATTTVNGHIDELTWTGCTRETKTIANGSLEIHHITGTTNGTVTGKDSEVTINGIFGSSCVYGTGAGTHLGTLVGASGPHAHATLAIKATVPRTAGGFLCPSTAVWNANYTVTSPTGLVVEAS